MLRRLRVAAHELRHRRPALLLRLAARPAGRAGDHHGAVGDLGQPAQRAAGRHWATRCRGWTASARDAERVFAFMPGTQGAVNWPPRRAVGDGAGVRRGTAARRFLDRPDAARASARACRKPARDAEGDLARAGAGRPRGHRRAQPARRVGALRAHAVRHRPAVLARPAHRAAARGQFHARRLDARRSASRRRSGAG